MEKRRTLTKRSIALGMATWIFLTPCGTQLFAASDPSPASPREAAEQSKKNKMPPEMDVEKNRKDTSLSAGAIVAALATIAIGILAVSASSDNR